MDRSFLSNVEVVKASRDFVCVRLATFEDAEEAEFLKKIYGRGDALENTVYAMLDPNGVKLTRAGRGPRYRGGGSGMAKEMSRVAANYREGSNKRWSDKALPEMKSLDLALNVASCDSIPLVLAIGSDKEDIVRLRKRLLPIAWHKDLAGQFAFAAVQKEADLRAITGLPEDATSGVYVVEPGTYGVSGTVLSRINLDRENQDAQYAEALAKYDPPVKNHRQHVRNGFTLGLKWETAIPVTDRMGAAAAKRLWGE